MTQKTTITLSCDRCKTKQDFTETPPPSKKSGEGFYFINASPVAGGTIIDFGDICSVCFGKLQTWWNYLD